jgi:dephospho-CoA kinase
MTSAFAVCGKIGSGKTSILRELERIHGWNTVSFGAYVKSLISDPDVSREDYQNLGQELFCRRGPQGLLQDALNFSRPKSSVHLIDGVRHVSVVTALRRVYSRTIVLFLKVDDQTRYERFLARSESDAQLSYDEFCKICNHPIEQGIDGIAGVSDAIINTSCEFSQVIAAVEMIAMKLL